MHKSKLLAASVIASFLAAAGADAAPRDPKRSTQQCTSNRDLCAKTADDDYKNCQRQTPKSNCAGDRKEDKAQCTADFNKCKKNPA